MLYLLKLAERHWPDGKVTNCTSVRVVALRPEELPKVDFANEDMPLLESPNGFRWRVLEAYVMPDDYENYLHEDDRPSCVKLTLSKLKEDAKSAPSSPDEVADPPFTKFLSVSDIWDYVNEASAFDGLDIKDVKISPEDGIVIYADGVTYKFEPGLFLERYGDEEMEIRSARIVDYLGALCPGQDYRVEVKVW